MPMDKNERELFERMTKAQERLADVQEQMTRVHERAADAVEKQQPSKVAQFFTTAAAITAVVSTLSIVDLVIKWFTGG
jgi:chemotaxis regulatin CheY-phosphate phosphatase CheZ